ncbi:hypothetical protein F0562_005146 [Nyssa sinensis]|uniref:Chlororespiratory reduction 7 n=1 Tax=Nyssa sinensis TaxID=561372 RepID=A0A5J5ALQ5_9ASTE|nr:hypothetical protein F0562_005146 [Nyssa sinensis]
MLTSSNVITMEGAMEKQLFRNGIQSFNCKIASNHHIQSPAFQPKSVALTQNLSSSVYPKLHKIASQNRNTIKYICQIFAMRRRRANIQSDTYVLMEPGQNEEFVSEEELRTKLKGWLENWPGKTLPPDLARFETIDDAVTYLVKSVCELEIDGDVGSIQWYEVRLE